MDSDTFLADLRKIIVCFLFDGTPKYTKMTLNAVNSFLTTTPGVAVGLLLPPNIDHETVEDILNQIPEPSRPRVSLRTFSTHFQNWNPTQHKLDIKLFADEFETIFWLDSDAIVYNDLGSLLWEFHVSPCKVAFLKDHVCFNQLFLHTWNEWRKTSDPFIPQACFMGFKRDIINEFFNAWEEIWRTWIEPVPFYHYPNPLPSFPGSAFCTEQYALGMVLETSLITRQQISEIRRITFPLRGVPLAEGGFPINLPGQNSSSLSFGSFSLEKVEKQLSSFSLGTSSSSGEYFSGPLFQFSFPLTSWAGSAGISYSEYSGLSYSGLLGSFTSSFSGSFGSSSGGSFSSSGTSFSGSFGSWARSKSERSSYSGSFASSGQGGDVWVPVDNIGGGIVHFYSMFYDQSYNWWQSNREGVIPRLGDYWKNNNNGEQ